VRAVRDDVEPLPEREAARLAELVRVLVGVPELAPEQDVSGLHGEMFGAGRATASLVVAVPVLPLRSLLVGVVLALFVDGRRRLVPSSGFLLIRS